MKEKKIFIALNNFETPNSGADYGLQLAKRLDRVAYFYGLVKVPVYTPPMNIVGMGVDNSINLQMESVKQNAEQRLIDIYLEARKEYAKVDYGIEVGFPEPSILAKTEAQTPYIVVLENNSSPSTLHEWLGTYETRMAQEIESPVLVVPQEYSWKPVDRIVYLMDMEDHKVENMRVLSSIAKELETSLTVVVIANRQDEAHEVSYEKTVEVLKNLLGYNDIDFHRVFTEESAEAVTRIIESTAADWLAFEHKSHSFLERIFDDYNTKRLILQSEIPVLVF